MGKNRTVRLSGKFLNWWDTLDKGEKSEHARTAFELYIELTGVNKENFKDPESSVPNVTDLVGKYKGEDEPTPQAPPLDWRDKFPGAKKESDDDFVVKKKSDSEFNAVANLLNS